MNNTAPVASGDTNTDGLAAPVLHINIDQRLAEIEAEKARIVSLDEERNRLLREKEIALAKRRQEVIATIPGLLQVANLEEAVELMRTALRGTSAPRVANRAPGLRIPESTRAQARQMLEAKTPVAKVAKALRVGEATVWLWKRSWGLTGTRPRAKAKAPKAPRRRTVNTQDAMDPATRAQLVAKLKEGKTPIRVLAKEYGRSRARLYQLIDKLGIKSPSLQHAA